MFCDADFRRGGPASGDYLLFALVWLLIYRLIRRRKR